MAAPPDARTRDWDQVSRAVADAYFPHELTLLGGGTAPRPTLWTLDLGPVLIGYVGWGADVAIACDYPNAYEINMPVSGRLESRGRHGAVISTPGEATVFRADTPSLISHWDSTCTVLGVKFDADWLDREAEQVLDRDVVRVGGLVPDQLRLDSGAARDWQQLVTGLAEHLSGLGTFSGSSMVAEQLAGAVSACFLLASCPDDRSSAPPRPRAFASVVDALHHDPARPWTAAQMAGRRYECASTPGGLSALDGLHPDRVPRGSAPAAGRRRAVRGLRRDGRRRRGSVGILQCEPVRLGVPPALRTPSFATPLTAQLPQISRDDTEAAGTVAENAEHVQ